MKAQILKAIAAMSFALNAGAALATTINFDDIYVAPPIPDTNNPGQMAYHGSFPSQGYMGFKWWGGEDQWSWVVSSGPGIFEGQASISGDNYAWSNGGTWLELSAIDGTAFNFQSFFARAARDEFDATVRGFFQGTEISTQVISLNTNYEHYNFNMRNVDRVVFDATYNTLFDNIVVNQVPEPGSIALFGLAAAGLAIARRRKV